MLTPGQIAHFETFGFLVLRQLFTPEEAVIMKRESDEIFEEVRGGGPFTGEIWESVVPFFERRPFLSRLPGDDWIYDLAVSLVGPNPILEVTEGNLHTGNTDWHGSKLPGKTMAHAKIAFYLEPLTKETGCLRVIPGSHTAGPTAPFAPLRDRNLDPDFKPFGLPPTEVPSYAIECQPGDVVVFVEETLHAAFGGKAGRQQHAINVVADPKTEEDEGFIKAMYQGTKFCYRPSESYINSDHPRMRRMVSRLVEWGFETSKV